MKRSGNRSGGDTDLLKETSTPKTSKRYIVENTLYLRFRWKTWE